MIAGMSDILPCETEIVRTIATELASELDFCECLLAFGVNLPQTKTDLHEGSLRHDTVVTAIGLFAKATTSFRATLHLCRIGCDRNALPVNRSLFETCLNLAFLIRRRVSLNQYNESKVKPRTPVNLHGKKLTTAFRTDLYNAWCILMDEKNVRRLTRMPGIKRRGKSLDKRIAAVQRPYVDAIGPAWEKEIRSANTCVGLSIENFAASLGDPFRRWHGLVYSSDSQHVHQLDMLQFLDADELTGAFSPRWFTSPDEIRTTMQKAAVLYLGCLCEIQKRFRFGPKADREIRAFSQELQNWGSG